MKTLVKYILLAVAMLMYAGCSNHPPSAAQFMNVKEKRFGFGHGGTLRTGDLFDGKCDYSHDDYKCFEETMDFDFSFLFRIHYGAIGISIENATPNLTAGFLSQYVGLLGWGWLAIGDEVFPYGGLMLIEELPITEHLKMGISEHISRNVYKVDENLGGFGFYTPDFYGEYGIGAYVSVWGVSMEFRYGWEIGRPKERFSVMLNYLIGVRGKGG